MLSDLNRDLYMRFNFMEQGWVMQTVIFLLHNTRPLLCVMEHDLILSGPTFRWLYIKRDASS